MRNNDSRIDRWNERYASDEMVWSITPTNALVEEIGHLSPGKALDLGCGEGRNAIWLARLGWNVTAVDFAENGLARGRQLSAQDNLEIRWICEDVTRLQPQAKAFDLVIMIFLQVPEPDRQLIIQNSIQSLVTGGHFVYIGHDVTNIEKGIGGPQDPAVLCTPEDVAADLPGFQISRAEVVTREYEPGHGGPELNTALDALIHGIKL
jgi:SAM-dependent methyltransferase